MENIEYRKADTGDYDECVKVFTDAFFDYDFTKIYCTESEERRYRFIEATFKVDVSLAIKKRRLFVMTENKKIVALTQIRAPEEKDYSICEYITHGIFRPLLSGGLKNTLGYIRLLARTETECNKLRDKWYMEAFAVSKEKQGKGYGSKMLREFLFEYIRSTNEKPLCLVTNSKSNFAFYSRNFFELLQYEELKFGNKKLGNWTLVKRFR